MRLKKILLLIISLTTIHVNAQTSIQQLPVLNSSVHNINKADWLLNTQQYVATIYRSENGKEIILSNGLVRRIFSITPNVACIDYSNLSNDQQLLRSVKAEARLTINGTEYNVGGLRGQKENAYLLPEWVNQFTKGENDFQFVSFEIKPITPYLQWKNKFWASNSKQATGKMISFLYQPGSTKLTGLQVRVNYELYDGVPLIVKSLTIENKGNTAFKLDRVVNEILGTVEEESAVVGKPEMMKKPHGIYVETNYAFNNAMRYDISDQTTHWKIDSTYTSQVNYNYQTPRLLEVYPEQAPGIE